MNHEPIDGTSYVTEIAVTVMRELQGRLDTEDLSERDDVAIGTAVGKAAWRGFLRGVATHSQAANERLSEPIQTWIQRPEGDTGEPDAWAEMFGGDA